MAAGGEQRHRELGRADRGSPRASPRAARAGLVAARHRLGHPGPGDGGQRVGAHVVARAFHGDDPREAGDAHLGRAVVGLADVADQARGRGEEHVGAVVLVAEVLDGGAHHVEGAPQVHLDHLVPVLLGHLVAHAVAQDAGRVDHRVQAAELVHRLLHHAPDRRQVGDALGVGDRLAAGGADLLGHVLGRRRPSPRRATSPPRSLTTTFAPSRAAISAVSRPMPLPPPVTRTTFPSSKPMTLPSSIAFA